jgi:hypothetical protein
MPDQCGPADEPDAESGTAYGVLVGSARRVGQAAGGELAELAYSWAEEGDEIVNSDEKTVPQRLKLYCKCGSYGTTEQAAEKLLGDFLCES